MVKGEADVVAHVVGATGIAEARRVVDAAFGYLRASALAGEAVSHPSLGAIRPRQREKEGVTRTVFRFDPEGEAKRAGGGKAGGGRGKAGGGAKGGKGKGGGAGRRSRGGGV